MRDMSSNPHAQVAPPHRRRRPDWLRLAYLRIPVVSLCVCEWVALIAVAAAGTRQGCNPAMQQQSHTSNQGKLVIIDCS